MPDYRRALDSLGPDDRDFVERFLRTTGFELDELDHVPPLRQIVGVLAVATLAARAPGGTGDDVAFRAAGSKLGLNGRTVLRRLQEWSLAAREGCADSAQKGGV